MAALPAAARAAQVYAGLLLATVVWSLAEVGIDGGRSRRGCCSGWRWAPA
jgi:hypothetical protein